MRKIALFALALCLTALPAMAGETEDRAEEGKELQTVAPAEDGTVSTDLFSVKVPEEIASICQVAVTENAVSFFETISRESFGGGFVGQIALYKSAAEYGMIPNYERIGEIRLEDGTLWNVIAEYPSDVQFDFNSEESTDHYQKISEALNTVIAESLTALEGSFIPQAETDTTSVFDSVLDRLSADLAGKKDREELEADGFSYLYAYSYDGDKDPLETIGYAYTDMDHDGYSELVIGSTEDDIIYDMYAQLDGEVSQVLTSGERSRWTLTGDKDHIYGLTFEGSGGAAVSEKSCYILAPGPELFLQTRFLYNAEKDPENPWFVSYSGEESEDGWYTDAEPLTEEEWKERQSYFGETVVPDYRPLSSR